jgi:hypothetical protein
MENKDSAMSEFSFEGSKYSFETTSPTNTTSDSSKDWVTFGAAQDRPKTSPKKDGVRKILTIINRIIKIFNSH